MIFIFLLVLGMILFGVFLMSGVMMEDRSVPFSTAFGLSLVSITLLFMTIGTCSLWVKNIESDKQSIKMELNNGTSIN